MPPCEGFGVAAVSGEEVILYRKVCLAYDLDPRLRRVRAPFWTQEEAMVTTTQGGEVFWWQKHSAVQPFSL